VITAQVEAAWRKLLEERLGLRYSEHSPVLKTAINRLCKKLDLTAEGALAVLSQRGDEHPMWVSVCDEVVVSSSRFFRDPEMYNAIDHWYKQRQPTTELTVISVGSADGREVYSLAMLLAELGSDYRIMGVDLSPKANSLAQAALYSERDIADIPEHYRGRFIEQIESGEYTVHHELKHNISFVEPTHLFNEKSLSADLISCQNTLMYLTQKQQINYLNWFEQHLRPGGMLVLSPTDQPQWKGNRLLRNSSPKVRAFIKPLGEAA